MSDWNAGGNFVQVAPGAYEATLIRIIDLGTQEGEYKGDKVVRRQNIITWELPFALMEDGQPFIVSKFYTASLGEKANLTKDLTSWLGKAPKAPFTTEQQKALLGKACQVIVTGREDSDKIKVSGLAPVSKSVEATMPKKPHNPTVFFSLDEFDQETFDNLSNGIKNIVAKSPEYAAVVSGEIEVEAEEDDSDSNVPF